MISQYMIDTVNKRPDLKNSAVNWNLRKWAAYHGFLRGLSTEERRALEIELETMFLFEVAARTKPPTNAGRRFVELLHKIWDKLTETKK